MNELITELRRVIALIDLCDSKGLPSGITFSDVDFILQDSADTAEKLRQLCLVRKSLHELLYAPPRK